MARVQFVETVMIPGGPGGALIPVKGVAATPYAINSDGTEGAQVSAYVDRTSMTQPTKLVTDETGTVSFWLESGDYNIHIDDQQSPPRITSYIRGFTAPVIDTNQLVVAAQNLIQYSGDTKFSLQTQDHGLKADGTYEWLLMNSDADGDGRKIDHTLYPGLHALLGSPTPDGTGMIRLPNISGRTLIAAGKAAGLSTRNLLDLLGEETHTSTVSEMPNHGHTLHAAATGVSVNGNSTGISVNGGVTGISASTTTNNAVTNASYYAGICTDNNIYSGSMGSGQNGAAPWGCSAHATGWVGTQMSHSHGVNVSDPQHTHGISDPQHNHGVTDPQHNHTLDAIGGGTPHNNMQPSAGMNLFVKS